MDTQNKLIEPYKCGENGIWPRHAEETLNSNFSTKLGGHMTLQGSDGFAAYRKLNKKFDVLRPYIFGFCCVCGVLEMPAFQQQKKKPCIDTISTHALISLERKHYQNFHFVSSFSRTIIGDSHPDNAVWGGAGGVDTSCI